MLDDTSNSGAGGIFTVGASLDPDEGELFVENDSGGDAESFQAASYEDVSYTGSVVSAVVTEQSGATIGTFTSEIVDDSDLQIALAQARRSLISPAPLSLIRPARTRTSRPTPSI